MFRDARLLELIEQAKGNNRDLRLAAANIAAARAQGQVTRAGRLPEVTATTGVSVRGDDSGNSQTDLNLGLGVPAFELDLFGRLAACAAVDKDAGYANVLLDIMKSKLRYSRGPRTAAYYAALAALGEIRADRAKFPVDDSDLKGLQMKSTLYDAARRIAANRSAT